MERFILEVHIIYMTRLIWIYALNYVLLFHPYGIFSNVYYALKNVGDTDVELVPVKYVVKRAASTTTSRPRSTTRPTTTTSRSKTITRSTTRSRPRPTSKPTAVSCYTCTYTKLKNGEEVNTACKNQTGTSRTVGLTHDCTTGCFVSRDIIIPLEFLLTISVK